MRNYYQKWWISICKNNEEIKLIKPSIKLNNFGIPFLLRRSEILYERETKINLKVEENESNWFEIAKKYMKELESTIRCNI